MNATEYEILKQIKIGYGVMLLCACIFIIQMYLAVYRGNIVSYGGAFVAIVCGYSVLSSVKKLKGCVVR